MVDCVLLYYSYATIAKENTSETLGEFGVLSSSFPLGGLNFFFKLGS